MNIKNPSKLSLTPAAEEHKGFRLWLARGNQRFPLSEKRWFRGVYHSKIVLIYKYFGYFVTLKELLKKFINWTRDEEVMAYDISDVIDNKKVFEIGVEWTDEKFADREEIIMPLLLRVPELCYYTGLFFIDERFVNYQEAVIKRLSKSPEYSYRAGADWSNERFGLAPDVLIKTVSENEKYSVLAGRYWNDQRFERAAEKLAEAVQHCNWISECHYDRYWSRERIGRLRDILKNKKQKNLSLPSGDLSLTAGEEGNLSLEKDAGALTVIEPPPWYKRLLGRK